MGKQSCWFSKDDVLFDKSMTRGGECDRADPKRGTRGVEGGRTVGTATSPIPAFHEFKQRIVWDRASVLKTTHTLDDSPSTSSLQMRRVELRRPRIAPPAIARTMRWSDKNAHSCFFSKKRFCSNIEFSQNSSFYWSEEKRHNHNLDFATIPPPGLSKQKAGRYKGVPGLHAHGVWTLWEHVWSPQWCPNGFGLLRNLSIAEDF